MKLITMAIIHLAGRGGRALSAMKSSIQPPFACAKGAIRFLDTAGVADHGHCLLE
jgi:hypothetical protein